MSSLWKTAGLAAVLLMLAFYACGGGQSNSTIVVDSTADSEGRDGLVTLREAILLATGQLAVADLDPGEADNVRGGPGAESEDTIVFDVAVFPPSEPTTVLLASSLPSLATGGDSVDGSQAGVIVDAASKMFDCFPVSSADNTIIGLEIQGCRTALALDRGAQSNIIGGAGEGQGNVISANDQGILFAGEGADSNQVMGNLIGTDDAGTRRRANRVGVMIGIGARDNVIGGSGVGERNVISGQTAVGVTISGESNLVTGNYIGTDVTGTASVPNEMEGIWITDGAQGNVIGGAGTGEGNVISGNVLFGVRMTGAGTSGNWVKGNYIGVDATGATGLGNRYGVEISFGAEGNTIGGSADGEGNVVSANNIGVVLRGSTTTGNTVQGNQIGTDASGEKPLRNSQALSIIDGAEDNTVDSNVIEE
jgi:hypothetical protein